MLESCFWLRSQPETGVSIASANKLSFDFSSFPHKERKADSGKFATFYPREGEISCPFFFSSSILNNNNKNCGGAHILLAQIQGIKL